MAVVELVAPYYMSPELKRDLDVCRKLVEGGYDEDIVIIIDGRERSGKSVLAQQVAKYLDPSFDLASIAFTNAEFVSFVQNNRKRAVVYDESIVGFHGSRYQEKESIYMDELLAMSGQKNLYTILLVPFYFESTKRTAIGRSEFLIHVYRDEAHRRGRYKVYDYKAKKKLYLLGKRLLDYSVQSPNYNGYFSNVYTVDEVAYRTRKAAAFSAFSKQAGGVVTQEVALQWIQFAKYYTLQQLFEKDLLKHGGLSRVAESLSMNLTSVRHNIDYALQQLKKWDIARFFDWKSQKYNHFTLQEASHMLLFEASSSVVISKEEKVTEKISDGEVKEEEENNNTHLVPKEGGSSSGS